MKYVDISQYCNKAWIVRGGCVPEGVEGWRLNENLLQDGKIGEGDYSFLMPQSAPDLLACCGQRIPLSGKTVDIAGFCVYGYFNEEFILHYADGTSEMVTLAYKDLADKQDRFLSSELNGEFDFGVRVFSFDFAHVNGKLRGGIYAHRLKAPRGKTFSGITLPNNYFINICGITTQ